MTRTPIRTIHVVAECRACNKMWDDYRKAASAARHHAEATGHRVHVERGQVWTYNPNKD